MGFKFEDWYSCVLLTESVALLPTLQLHWEVSLGLLKCFEKAL